VGGGVRRPTDRIRWDRVGRVALLVTLGIVVCLYIPPALSIYNTWRAERGQASNVRQLLRSNATLERQLKSVKQPSTVVTEARALGMVRSGEKAYVVIGMPR
jgi:cell division protein FtsB